MKRNKSNWLIGIITGVLIIISLFLWMCPQNKATISDVGVNLFVSSIIMGLTIFVINRILAKRDYDRELPIRIAAHRNIQIVLSRFISLWIDVYYKSVDEPYPKTAEELLSQDSFGKMLNNFDITSNPNATGYKLWIDYFSVQGLSWKKSFDECLNKYTLFIEPEIYDMIHNLIYNTFIFEVMEIASQLYKECKTSESPKNLGCCFAIPSEESIEIILNLIKWNNEKYKEYKNYSKYLHEVRVVFPEKATNSKLSCVVRFDELTQGVTS